MNGSRKLRTVLLCVAVATAALGAAAAPAAAHDTKTDGGYDVLFGGADEPIITGERQWLEIELTDAESGEPIEDVGESLTVTVQRSGAEEVYEADAEARHGEAGWYEAPIYFTEPGDYAVTIEGTVDGEEISATFQKTVESPDELMYPASEDGESGADDESGENGEESAALAPGFGVGAAAVALAALGAVLLVRRD